MLISYTQLENIKERIRRLFGAMPSRVQVAALPWRRLDDGSCEILLVTSRGTGRWVLPKGWQENLEEPHQAAAREAAEEAGVDGAIHTKSIGRFYYNKVQTSGLAWRCQVQVFPLEVDHMANKWPERKKRVRKWFSPDEAASLVNEPDLGELITGFSRNPRKFHAVETESA